MIQLKSLGFKHPIEHENLSIHGMKNELNIGECSKCLTVKWSTHYVQKFILSFTLTVSFSKPVTSQGKNVQLKLINSFCTCACA